MIFLDVVMPVMDGFATCRHLRKDPDTAQIPVRARHVESDGLRRVLGQEARRHRHIGKRGTPRPSRDMIKRYWPMSSSAGERLGRSIGRARDRVQAWAGGSVGSSARSRTSSASRISGRVVRAPTSARARGSSRSARCSRPSSSRSCCGCVLAAWRHGRAR